MASGHFRSWSHGRDIDHLQRPRVPAYTPGGRKPQRNCSLIDPQDRERERNRNKQGIGEVSEQAGEKAVPFVAAFDMYARGNPTDNKPIDGHYALYIIVVAGKNLNKDHNNSRYGAIRHTWSHTRVPLTKSLWWSRRRTPMVIDQWDTLPAIFLRLLLIVDVEVKERRRRNGRV
ncbi:hypothetical protein ALC53_01327 [Atta colombica]|uniref:Uncharacterized protein n=1 Tax=Atta colombica TaxID=520822 RepID=A0A195BUG8_9HYME|nr:hypothetical protein ALC53_01327 [Atta colombica]